MDMDLYLADLSSQFDESARRELRDEVEELTHAERVSVHMAHRIALSQGAALRIHVRGGDVFAGRVVEASPVHLLLRDEERTSFVPVSAIVAVEGLSGGVSEPPQARVKVSIGRVLRRLVNSETTAVINHDAGLFAGELVAVYADCVDLQPSQAVNMPGAAGIAPVGVICLSIDGMRRLSWVSSQW